MEEDGGDSGTTRGQGNEITPFSMYILPGTLKVYMQYTRVHTYITSNTV